jgi:hypothetical protein
MLSVLSLKAGKYERAARHLGRAVAESAAQLPSFAPRGPSFIWRKRWGCSATMANAERSSSRALVGPPILYGLEHLKTRLERQAHAGRQEVVFRC